jgi:endonuclease YncB( thermonuclease family)
MIGWAQLLGLLVVCHCIGAAAAETFSARVVGISDGDTITVLSVERRQRKIRLAGIDAPEKKQAFGQRSKQQLSDLVFGRDVVLECGKVDRYRRDVCVVLVGGRDANLAQVEAGLAWWYRKYAREQTAQQRADYEAAETRARAVRAGLWVDPAPVPPWEWRKGSRSYY